MELLHYGVKGMRWGHRKSAAKLNETRHIPEETKAEIRKGARRQAISTGIVSYSISRTFHKRRRSRSVAAVKAGIDATVAYGRYKKRKEKELF